MKRVVLGLCVVLALCLAAVPGHAFLFGNCCACNNQCCAVAPYEVHVSYTPIQPQPGECTYCTCLPYGCPDGAPVCPPCGPGPGPGCGPCGGGAPACAPACGSPCGLNLCGLASAPCCMITPVVSGAFGMVGGVLDCACGIVAGVLQCLGCCSPCSATPCCGIGGGMAPHAMAQ
jgi:hypothetical protein